MAYVESTAQTLFLEQDIDVGHVSLTTAINVDKAISGALQAMVTFTSYATGTAGMKVFSSPDNLYYDSVVNTDYSFVINSTDKDVNNVVVSSFGFSLQSRKYIKVLVSNSSSDYLFITLKFVKGTI